MKQDNQLTIVLPTYNRALFLDKSISSCLKQTKKTLSIIVGNNCSTDNTLAVLEKYRFQQQLTIINRKSNIGAIANIYELVHHSCSTPYAVIMSDDDYYINDEYLEQAVDLLESNAAVGFVHGEIQYEYSNANVIDNKRKSVLPFQSGQSFFMNFGNNSTNYAFLMTVVFRTRLFKKLNLFSDPSIPHSDSLAWLMLSTIADVAFINKPVARYVMHGGNAITSPNIQTWIDDVNFINYAYSYAVQHTKWPRGELDSWLYRQRRVYCDKVLRLLRGAPSWNEYFRHIVQLQKDHNFVKDPVLILELLKSFAHKALI